MPKARLEQNKELPKRWDFTHGAYFYRVPAKQREIWKGRARVRLGTTLEEARECYNTNRVAVERGRFSEALPSLVFRAALWKQIGYIDACGISLGMLQSIYTSARCSATLRNLSFSLHPRHLIDLANRAAGRCMLTGIEWDSRATNANGKRPWTPSLDRIDSQKGYEPDNTRLVCTAVNLALGDFGDKVLTRIAIALVDRVAQVDSLTQ